MAAASDEEEDICFLLVYSGIREFSHQ
ncbi:uncharacterized protein G2W53_004306 [Senna tora]|uniref:Uncharacterized protein n=1 Tax=Senna tora TaxID=362788 RepID=A0A834XEY5_9FABA|nr:uncharacterized protein G2W53_004306 [Senna tora]